MIIKCFNCLKEYNVSGLAVDDAVKCVCGDIIVVPDVAKLEGTTLINKFVEFLQRDQQVDSVQFQQSNRWELKRDSVHIQMFYDRDYDMLIMESVVMPLPSAEPKRLKLLIKLLELNQRSTGAARFSISAGLVFVTFMRSIFGLDFSQFHDALASVCRTIDDYEHDLRSEFFNDDLAGAKEIR